MTIGEHIITVAKENGATLAGIAGTDALRVSPSHLIYPEVMNYGDVVTPDDDEELPDDRLFPDGKTPPDNQLFNWPSSVKSLLVVGLSHPKDKPELDLWDGRGTPGNRILIDIIKRTSLHIENRLGIKTRKLHYYVEKGGVFLKDAAVLAGLGSIGKNNMLITPSYGPRIRLRALFLESEICPTGPMDFDPCADCGVNCRSVCPENAMDKMVPIFRAIESPHNLPARDGNFDRKLCNTKMEKDVEEGTDNNPGTQPIVKFCRICELSCPVGKTARK